MPSSDLTHWDRFCLLNWKNFLVLWNNRRQMICVLLMSFIMCIPMILVRNQTNPKIVPEKYYETIDMKAAWTKLCTSINERREAIKRNNPKFESSVYVPKLVIGFASNLFPDMEKLLNEAISSLDPQPELKGFINCRTLEKMIRENNYLAGVCFHNLYDFDDSDTNNKPIIQILNFTMIFPTELRMVDYKKERVWQRWDIDRLYEDIRFTEDMLDRRNEEIDGGHPGYVREGFIPLQNAISKAYLDQINFKNEKLPDVELRRFPYKSYIDDPLRFYNYTVSCMVLFGFLMPVISFTYLITREKEHYLKQFIKTLGVPNFINFASWSAIGMFLFGCSSLITLASLKLKWNNDFSIINQTDPICLLVVLITYSMAVTTFCVFVSSLFKESHSSVAVVGILWITTIVPYLAETDKSFSYYLFINTILGNAFEAINYYEIYDQGVQWKTLFNGSIMNYASCGKAICCFLVHFIIYLLLAVIIESTSPWLLLKSRTWNTFFKSSGKGRIPNNERSSYVHQLSTQVTQVEPLYKTQLVSIENVTKIYEKREVVRSVSLNLYENDITVLLGHNGSGKTTLLSLLLGVIPLSEGRIRIEDRDVAEYNNVAYSNLGGCLRDHLLFGDLNVENQIRFFSRLKGLSWNEADKEVEKYCRQMELTDKRKILTKHLTVGLRHQLAVCCAFSGESKIVILDEPNFGMDLSASKLVLQLLLNEKRNRTILVSTNSTTIADTIADRVSIMTNGTIICSGSIVFLRNMYNKGTRLLITKDEGCKPETVTKFLQRFIPNIEIDSQVVKTIIYTIHETYSHLIGEILENLEKDLLNLSIESYAIDDLTIHDIVLKMTSNVNSHIPETIKPRRNVRADSIQSDTVIFSLLSTNKSEKLKALFFTRMIYYIRHKCLFLSQVMLPIIFTIIIFNQSKLMPPLKQYSQSITLAMDSYPNSQVIVGEASDVNEYMHRIAYEYKEQIFWLKNVHHIEEVNGDQFEATVIKIIKNDPIIFEKYFIAGSVFTNEKIIAYFNNFPLHAAPIALNMAYNSIARNIRNKHTAISTQIKAFQSDSALRNIVTFDRLQMSFYFVVLVLLSTLITLSNSVYDMTKSHSELFRLWLNIGGAATKDFWLMSFCFDCIKTIIVAVATILTALACLTVRIANADVLGCWFLCLLLGGVCINSIHYVNVKLFKDAQPCFRASLAIGAVGVTFFIIDYELDVDDYFGGWMKYFLLAHPYFAMGHGLLTVILVFGNQIGCKNKDFKMLKETFENVEPQCKDNVSFFDKKFGIFPNVFALVAVTILAWIFIFILENLAYFRKFWIFKVARDDSESAWVDHMRRHSPNAPSTVVEDNVTHEEIVVNTLKPYEQQSIAIIVDRVGKNFGVVGALHRFSFVLDKCQICGILGLNGAGKSVLLKILVNEFTQTYGEVRILGANILENRKNVFRKLGYCPENLDIILEYTPREILELFAVLSKISPKMLSTHCENLASSLGFYDYYDHVLKICSDGIQKRVGTALALIGNQPIILLDEPFSAIDSAGKLMIYQILAKACRSGKCVLFTSLNPIECQRICNKIIIMIDGRLIDTGKLSDLYNRNEYGFFLQVRMKPYYIREEHQRFSLENSQMRVIAFIRTTFEGSSFRYMEGNLLTFIVPIEHNIFRIYSVLRRNAFTYNIESFGLARAPLQMVYLNIVDRYKLNLY